jgi:DNA-binding CsgD family transcriptional regulator
MEMPAVGPADRTILAAGAGLVILFMIIEIFEDGASALSIGTGLVEAMLMVSPLVAVAFIYRQMRQQRLEQAALTREIAAARADGATWRAETQDLVRGLGAAIDEQFRAWELTAAESEVALLVLKGLNFEEIGVARGTSARTVKQQARAVYAKAGLSGRAALSAYFLEDLLLPMDQR